MTSGSSGSDKGLVRTRPTRDWVSILVFIVGVLAGAVVALVIRLDERDPRVLPTIGSSLLAVGLYFLKALPLVAVTAVVVVRYQSRRSASRQTKLGAPSPPERSAHDAVVILRSLTDTGGIPRTLLEELQPGLSENLVRNGDFQNWTPDNRDIPIGWTIVGGDSKRYPSGQGTVVRDYAGARNGTPCVRCTNTKTGQMCWLRQQIPLEHHIAFPATFLIGAWSRADGVAHAESADYSVYADWRADRDCPDPFRPAWCPFPVGDHDWVLRGRLLILQKRPPGDFVAVHLLFRGDHTGTAWFDGVFLYHLT